MARSKEWIKGWRLKGQIALAVATLGEPTNLERSADPLGLSIGPSGTKSLDNAYNEGMLDGYSLAWDDDALRGHVPRLR